MTRDTMMELWRKEFEESYYQWNLTPQVYEYLDGKTEQLEGPGVSGRKYYACYNDWMIKELDGENAELARRMLMVISKIRATGMISDPYRFADDAETCLRIGYDFDSIVKQGVIRFGSNLRPASIYKTAELLVNYMPKEAEAYSDQLQTSKLQFWKKQNADFGLALYIAIVWLKKDPKRYERYVYALISAASKGGDYVLGMLYYSYSFSPELKEMLREKLQSDISVARNLYSISEQTDLRPLLAEVGAPMWPYYGLIATDINWRVDRAPLICQLYADDKATFVDTYTHLAEQVSSQDAIYSLFLLSLLFRDGEGEPYSARAKRTVIHLMQRFLNEYSNQNSHNNPKPSFSQEDIMDTGVSVEEWKIWLASLRLMGWGNARLFAGALGVMYEYVPEAKRFVDLLLLKNEKRYYADSVANVVGYVLEARKKWLGIPMRDSLQMLLKEDNDLGIAQAFKAYCANSGLLADAVSVDDVMQNQQVALNILFDNTLSLEETIEWIQFIYMTCGLTDYQPLVNLLSSKSKNLRKQAETLISKDEENLRPVLETHLPDLKGDALAIAKRTLKRWDNERKFGEGFVFDNVSVVEYCTDNYDKDNRKHIAWIPEDMLTDVRFADLTEKAPMIVLQYILSEYLSQEEPYKMKTCDKVAAMLHPQDLQGALENIYQFWKDNGAEAKKKIFMVPYCIYASDSQILRLKTQLKDWAEASRGALAAFVVNAIAMNGGNVALMMVDAISVKFPNNQVKNAAKAAFAFAAKALDIPEDELSDKIVPTLDFSREGEKTLDYGSRTFTITLLPDFSLTIFDNDKQKTIKSMPSPGANDDAVKAAAAKKEFSELKKQIKATVQSQTNRLEKVLMNGRCWDVSAWNTLFVENPIMHCFAMGLIWGVYEGDQLIDTFRYMEDGTFNTVDEEEYSLPENARITLVHPVELSDDLLAQWKQQLDDYEVVQPLPQLSTPVVTLEDKDREGKKIIRYKGTLTQSGKIAGLAKKQNMVRGDVGDGGSYVAFHWVDKYLNVAALLYFEYMYMGQEYNEDVMLGDVVFYRLGEDQSLNDEPKENMICDITKLPARFVNSVIGVFDILSNK